VPAPGPDGPDADVDTDVGDAPGIDPPADLAFALIAAVAADGTVGVDGRIPWDYPSDVRHFRETTTGHPVVMGRRTYEGIVAGLGEPLPGRTSVVLTRTREAASFPDGAVRAGSLSAAVERAAADARERGVDTAYVAGGATVYEQFLGLADRMVLTEVPGEYGGDARFPAFDGSAWREIARERDGDLAFVTYERVGSSPSDR